MNAATIIAIVALAISITNSVFTAKTYQKNRRLEFLQRRDHLSQKISELNDRNTDFQLISARYALVALKSAALPLREEQAERNSALIASLNKQREGVEQRIKLWDENIERIRLLYSKFTSETHAPELEELIAIVQLASDNLKKASHGYSATLYILETTNEFIKSNLAERDEKIRQINLDTDEKIRQINRDFEIAIEKLKNK